MLGYRGMGRVADVRLHIPLWSVGRTLAASLSEMSAVGEF